MTRTRLRPKMDTFKFVWRKWTILPRITTWTTVQAWCAGSHHEVGSPILTLPLAPIME